jgi:hypothetical protein
VIDAKIILCCIPMNSVYLYIEPMCAVTSVKERERGEKTPLALIPN